MTTKIKDKLLSDVRYKEAMQACMNCGICTAVCPAAEFYDYDPRNMITIVQRGDEAELEELLSGDTIWYCGQCMSCKTRCPRNNCPGMVISVLRKISQEEGYFTKSKKGRQQYLIKEVIGNNIIEHGYCLHPTAVTPEGHPEQGSVWRWIYENMQDVYDAVGANLGKDGAGALRKIPEDSLNELRLIFEATGGIALFNDIQRYSEAKATELGLETPDCKADMQAYRTHLANEL